MAQVAALKSEGLLQAEDLPDHITEDLQDYITFLAWHGALYCL